jgi:hypothetical protein
MITKEKIINILIETTKIEKSKTIKMSFGTYQNIANKISKNIGSCSECKHFEKQKFCLEWFSYQEPDGYCNKFIEK